MFSNPDYVASEKGSILYPTRASARSMFAVADLSCKSYRVTAKGPPGREDKPAHCQNDCRPTFFKRLNTTSARTSSTASDRA